MTAIAVLQALILQTLSCENDLNRGLRSEKHFQSCSICVQWSIFPKFSILSDFSICITRCRLKFSILFDSDISRQIISFHLQLPCTITLGQWSPLRYRNGRDQPTGSQSPKHPNNYWMCSCSQSSCRCGNFHWGLRSEAKIQTEKDGQNRAKCDGMEQTSIFVHFVWFYPISVHFCPFLQFCPIIQFCWIFLFLSNFSILLILFNFCSIFLFSSIFILFLSNFSSFFQFW